MEVTISRSMSPEMEKAVQAVKNLAEAGEMDLSSVITPYDIIFLILFAIVAIPLFISAVSGLVKIFTETKKVKRADAVLDIVSKVGTTHQGADMDAILEALQALQPAKATVRRKSGNTQQFDQVTQSILNSLKMQRRQKS